MAAIAVSVLFTRTRQTQTPETIQKDDVVEGAISLDALRAAGI